MTVPLPSDGPLVHYRRPGSQPIECGTTRPVLDSPGRFSVTGALADVTCGPCRMVAMVCNVLAEANGGEPAQYRAMARARLRL